MITRILKVITALVVAVVGGFFAAGLIFPTFTVETRVIVNKPREVVWRYFVDASRQREWNTNIASIEPVAGKPLEQGSVFRINFDEGGRKIVMTETVTEVVPYEAYGFVLENDVIRAEDRITFIDRGAQTEVVDTNRVTGGNLLWRSLFVVMRTTFTTQIRARYEKFRDQAEQLSPDY